MVDPPVDVDVLHSTSSPGPSNLPAALAYDQRLPSPSHVSVHTRPAQIVVNTQASTRRGSAEPDSGLAAGLPTPPTPTSSSYGPLHPSAAQQAGQVAGASNSTQPSRPRQSYGQAPSYPALTPLPLSLHGLIANESLKQQDNMVPPPRSRPKPQEEVCVECMMRDRDMPDVDVTPPGVWSRPSDADYEDLVRRYREEDPGSDRRSSLAHERRSIAGNSSSSGHASRRVRTRRQAHRRRHSQMNHHGAYAILVITFHPPHSFDSPKCRVPTSGGFLSERGRNAYGSLLLLRFTSIYRTPCHTLLWVVPACGARGAPESSFIPSLSVHALGRSIPSTLLEPCTCILMHDMAFFACGFGFGLALSFHLLFSFCALGSGWCNPNAPT